MGLRTQNSVELRGWARGQALLDSQMVPPCPARFPSLLSSHLAMARKANSTFMPVLALVSMKGTPYSCQGECPQGQPLVAPTRRLAHRQSLTLASISPSSERITLPLLTSACQAQVGHSGERSLDPSWLLSCPSRPIFCPRSRCCPPSAGGWWDFGWYDWHGARVSTWFRLSSPAPSPGTALPLGKVGNSPRQWCGDPASEG